jgi:hypothetical protein
MATTFLTLSTLLSQEQCVMLVVENAYRYGLTKLPGLYQTNKTQKLISEVRAPMGHFLPLSMTRRK